MRDNPSANFTSTTLLHSFEQVASECPEKAKIVMQTLHHYANVRKRVCDGDTIKHMAELVMVFQQRRQAPFFLLTENLKPGEEDMGMISTRYMVSLKVDQFDAYMDRRGYPDLREESQFRLQDGKWPASVTAKLRHLFDKLLTSMLLRYLTTECHADYEQKLHIVRDTDTRLNFAALIGCAIYANHAECALNKTLEEAIRQGIDAGCEPGEADGEDCSLAYCGFVLKSELVSECRDLGVERKDRAASMKAFSRTFRAEQAEFAASLTHGFGAPETSSPEDSQEETKSGLQHGNQAAFEVPTSLFTPEKKTLQPVHPITPVQVEINR